MSTNEIELLFDRSYPGALMLIFKSTNGRCELHGGYMYTSAELEEVSAMWNNAQVDAVIIYNNPRSVRRPNYRIQLE